MDLVHANTDILWINLNQFSERILQSPRNGHYNAHVNKYNALSQE